MTNQALTVVVCQLHSTFDQIILLIFNESHDIAEALLDVDDVPLVDSEPQAWLVDAAVGGSQEPFKHSLGRFLCIMDSKRTRERQSTDDDSSVTDLECRTPLRNLIFH